MTELTTEAVLNIMKDVLFRDDEDRTNAVVVEGIMHSYGFNPDRLKAKEPEIRALLAELPEAFHVGKGGGWSFLNAAEDKHGHHWGEHPDMEALFALGIGIGAATIILPREVWPAFPGGMPYIQVNLDKD